MVGLVTQEGQWDGVSMVCDNLDLIAEDELLQVLHALRDTYFRCPWVHWFLIGGGDLGRAIAGEKRLEPFLANEPVVLERAQLGLFRRVVDKRVDEYRLRVGGGVGISDGQADQYSDAIEKRYGRDAARIWRARIEDSEARVGGRRGKVMISPPASPFDWGAVRVIYAATHGDLRAAFGLMGRMLREGSLWGKLVKEGEPITFDDAALFIRSDASADVSRYRLSSADLSVLREMYRASEGSALVLGDSNPTLFGCDNWDELLQALERLEGQELVEIRGRRSAVELQFLWPAEELALSGALDRLETTIAPGMSERTVADVALDRIQLAAREARGDE